MQQILIGVDNGNHEHFDDGIYLSSHQQPHIIHKIDVEFNSQHVVGIKIAYRCGDGKIVDGQSSVKFNPLAKAFTSLTTRTFQIQDGDYLSEIHGFFGQEINQIGFTTYKGHRETYGNPIGVAFRHQIPQHTFTAARGSYRKFLDFIAFRVIPLPPNAMQMFYPQQNMNRQMPQQYGMQQQQQPYQNQNYNQNQNYPPPQNQNYPPPQQNPQNQYQYPPQQYNNQYPQQNYNQPIYPQQNQYPQQFNAPHYMPPPQQTTIIEVIEPSYGMGGMGMGMGGMGMGMGGMGMGMGMGCMDMGMGMGMGGMGMGGMGMGMGMGMGAGLGLGMMEGAMIADNDRYRDRGFVDVNIDRQYNGCDINRGGFGGGFGGGFDERRR